MIAILPPCRPTLPGALSAMSVICPVYLLHNAVDELIVATPMYAPVTT